MLRRVNTVSTGGWLTVPRMSVSGEQVDMLVEPPVYGSVPLLAFSTDHRAAAAVSTVYDVRFYDAAARETVSIVRDEIGPRLTREERDEVGAILDSTRVHHGYPYTEIRERHRRLQSAVRNRPGRLGDVREARLTINPAWFVSGTGRRGVR